MHRGLPTGWRHCAAGYAAIGFVNATVRLIVDNGIEPVGRGAVPPRPLRRGNGRGRQGALGAAIALMMADVANHHAVRVVVPGERDADGVFGVEAVAFADVGG